MKCHRICYATSVALYFRSLILSYKYRPLSQGADHLKMFFNNTFFFKLT